MTHKRAVTEDLDFIQTIDERTEDIGLLINDPVFNYGFKVNSEKKKKKKRPIILSTLSPVDLREKMKRKTRLPKLISQNNMFSPSPTLSPTSIRNQRQSHLMKTESALALSPIKKSRNKRQSTILGSENDLEMLEGIKRASEIGQQPRIKGRISISYDENAPLVMKMQKKDDSLKTLIVQNKTIKNNKRKGAMITSQKDLEEFMKAMEKTTKNQKNENEREFQGDDIIDKILKSNRKLKNIYLKCITQIRNGEQIDKYIDYVKKKDEKEYEKESKAYTTNLQQIEDEMIMEGVNPNDKMIRSSVGDKPVFLEENKTSIFQKQVSRIDVIPKISEHLAYSNRNGYLKKFNYDYSEDNDFLFMKDYNKTLNIETRPLIKKKKIDIDRLLEETEKGKDYLIRRIDNNRRRYIKDGYVEKKPKHKFNIYLKKSEFTRRRNKIY